MKKKLSILFALVLVASLCLVPAVASANPGPPTIDGVISSGEWDGATVIPVASSMGTVSVIADANYMYVLLDIVDSNDARIQYVNEVGNDQVSININPTAGVGTWGFPYDLIFETSALSGGGCVCACPADGGHHCLPWNPKVNSGALDGWATRWFPNNVQGSLPGDLKSATVYSGGKRVTEWKIPLAAIGVSVGAILEVGGAIDVGDGNSYVYPVGLDWNNPATFVNIIVRGNTAVGVTANVPDIVAINVSPTSIDFGTVLPGQTVTGSNIVVTNIGTHEVDVNATIPSGTVLQYLQLAPAGSGWLNRNWPDIITDLAMGASAPAIGTRLPVPAGYTPGGSVVATLLFIARAS